MRTEAHNDDGRRRGVDPVAGGPPANPVPPPPRRRPVLFVITGCARPGWQVRAYGDPDRLRHLRLEEDALARRPRRPTPPWVRAWVQKFARR